MFLITKREAAQISVGDKKVIRRAWYRCAHEAGSKVPVVLEPKGRAPYVLDILGVVEETVDQMTDAKAREEGFRNLGEWKTHWADLYKGSNRLQPDTRIFALRFRRGDLTHKRRQVMDDVIDGMISGPMDAD